MVFMPPRSGKSEIISKRFPAWCLGKNPKRNIVVASYGADLANEFGRKCKHVTQDRDFTKVFEDFKLADDKREGGNWETSEGGGYYSVGIGGALTGRGFDIGIIDDPVKNREDAESLTYRNKAWEWYTSTFFTRQQGSSAAIVVLMTRWNTDDLAGRILEQDTVGWEIISFPAIDEDGKPLCNREGYGLEFYENQKRAIGVRDFAALYQQDPIASTGNVFKKEDLRYFNLSDLNKDDFTVAVSVDPAFSTRDGSDDTAIVVSAKHKTTKEIYVLDVFAAPLLPSEAYSYILSSAERWKDWTLEYISIEEATISAAQQDFLNGFNRYMRDQGKFYTVLTFQPRGKGKKEDRIKFSLEPMFNRHAIYFRADDKGSDDWIKLEEQVMKFPALAHDDVIDSVSQAVMMWEDRGGDNGMRQQDYVNKIKLLKYRG
jgi:hypothetical protein